MSVPESVFESGTESANGVLEPVTNKNVPCCKLVTVEVNEVPDNIHAESDIEKVEAILGKKEILKADE